ncbi:MAG: serine--tRNA ligase, partial [Candidatus Thermoplasmatota archaeon]|nr:serine--tRNA ligase [Candidatus Thermoplasmatota archaeon]
MIDIKLIREHPDVVRANIEKRKNPTYLQMLNNLITYDEQWRQYKQDVDALRQKRNQLTQTIQNLKKEGKTEEIPPVIQEAKNIPQHISELEDIIEKVDEKKQSLLLTLPNLLHESVPYGEDDSGNRVVKEWGDKPHFSFSPKSHVDLVEDLHGADIQRAAKTSGARFYFLLDELVSLEFALIQHAIQLLKRRGYHLIIPPTLVKGDIMQGGGFLPTYR